MGYGSNEHVVIQSNLSEISALQTDSTSNKGKINELTSQLAQKAAQADLALKADQASLTLTNNTVATKADKTYVDQQVGSIGNASPKGVYATLSALQTAFPTGATGVYLVTADGKWYYWNSSAWTAGGTYQATAVADGSMTLQKMSYSDEMFPYLQDSLIYNPTTKVLTVPSVSFMNDSYTFLTVNASGFPTQHPNGKFDFTCGIATTLVFDRNAAQNGLYPFLINTTGGNWTANKYQYREIARVSNNGIASIYDVKIIGTSGTYATTADLATKQDKYTFDENQMYLLLPDKLFMIDDEPTKIYKNSCLSQYDKGKEVEVVVRSAKDVSSDTGNPPYTQYINGCIDLKSTDLGSTIDFKLLSNQKMGHSYGKTITKVSKAISAVSNKYPKFIFFGDSTTILGSATAKLTRNLGRYGINASPMGTVNDNYGLPCEARGGWTYAQYVGYRTVLNDGSAIAQFPNFLKLATDTDKQNHPDWCFTRTGSVREQNYNQATDKNQNFYIFDFANYLTINSYQNPNVVLMALSINDFSCYAYDEAKTVCELAIKIMCSQILSAVPTCKIGVSARPTNGAGAYTTFTNVVVPWLVEFNSFINTLKSQLNTQNIDYVAEHLYLSHELSFPNTSTTLSNGNNDYTQSDTIHMDSAGYWERTKPFMYYLINQL